MENFAEYLQQYNQEIEPLIEGEFDDLKKHASGYEEATGELVDDYKELMMEGGKRLRGSLIKLGYEMFGGRSGPDILRCSLAMETIHSALLIHDDIMDRSLIRRNQPAIHTRYKDKFGAHNGESLAISIADVGFFRALEDFTLGGQNMPPQNFNRALVYLCRRLQEVGFGQTLDVMYEHLKRFNEKDVMKIHTLKTAEYTISGPLAIGALLAGATDQQIKALEGYGIPVGVAFQLRDDELGMFSTEVELGKPIGSDTKEGKATLLIAKALEVANDDDREFLEVLYGNKRIGEDDLDKVKEIVEKTGALRYSQRLCRELVEEGKLVIPRITRKTLYKKYLSELADAGIKRTV